MWSLLGQKTTGNLFRCSKTNQPWLNVSNTCQERMRGKVRVWKLPPLDLTAILNHRIPLSIRPLRRYIIQMRWWVGEAKMTTRAVSDSNRKLPCKIDWTRIEAARKISLEGTCTPKILSRAPIQSNNGGIPSRQQMKRWYWWVHLHLWTDKRPFWTLMRRLEPIWENATQSCELIDLSKIAKI